MSGQKKNKVEYAGPYTSHDHPGYDWRGVKLRPDGTTEDQPRKIQEWQKAKLSRGQVHCSWCEGVGTRYNGSIPCLNCNGTGIITPEDFRQGKS